MLLCTHVKRSSVFFMVDFIDKLANIEFSYYFFRKVHTEKFTRMSTYKKYKGARKNLRTVVKLYLQLNFKVNGVS